MIIYIEILCRQKYQYHTTQGAGARVQHGAGCETVLYAINMCRPI